MKRLSNIQGLQRLPIYLAMNHASIERSLQIKNHIAKIVVLIKFMFHNLQEMSRDDVKHYQQKICSSRFVKTQTIKLVLG